MSAYSLLGKDKGKHMIVGVQKMKYFYAITYFDSKCNFFVNPSIFLKLQLDSKIIGRVVNQLPSSTANFTRKRVQAFLIRI